ncbi:MULTISPECIES: hypothetical protein [unclassified Mesorhizobium]|uniref:hypothetical protein n=1 Tax=unclassified Mesorhizobium TaxID=325217 RepID=UPI00112C071D|nr:MULTISPECIES: hypothetical protein [unclassified Mesorhizobium]
MFGTHQVECRAATYGIKLEWCARKKPDYDRAIARFACSDAEADTWLEGFADDTYQAKELRSTRTRPITPSKNPASSTSTLPRMKAVVKLRRGGGRKISEFRPRKIRQAAAERRPAVFRRHKLIVLPQHHTVASHCTAQATSALFLGKFQQI